MSGPHTEDVRLTPAADVLAPWRELLAQHTNEAASGLCPICRVDGCERWRWAGARLAEADGAEPAEAKT